MVQPDVTHFGTCAKPESVVERGSQDGGHKMREVGSTFVELEVAHDTVIGEIFCYARFGNSKMFRQARLDGIGAAATGTTTQKAANGDAQGLAWFNVIIGRKIGVAEEEHAGTN